MTALSAQDKMRFMERALEISRNALPDCRPNPPVGCVIVVNAKIVAEGYTHPPGQAHAEAAALEAFREKLSDAVVFVTLEPCSFIGRTPSCARALIERGAKKVIVAMEDPHPKNQGRGIQMLRDAGIDVELGLLHDEVGSFLYPYLDRTTGEKTE